MLPDCSFVARYNVAACTANDRADRRLPHPDCTWDIAEDHALLSIACCAEGIMKQCGCCATHSHKNCGSRKNSLTATKKSPGHFTLPGPLQVVASACGLFFDPGGEGR